MLTRTTITTDSEPYLCVMQENCNCSTCIQEFIDAELDQYMRTIIVPRIRRKFGVTVTVEVS